MDFTDHTTLAWIFFSIEWAIRVGMMVIVPARRSPAAAKGWLLLIFFEPIFGSLLYLALGRLIMPGWRRKQLNKLPSALAPTLARLRAHPNVFEPLLPPNLMHAVTLARNLSHMPILGGNAAELLTDYEGIIQRLVKDIDAAQHHVHLLYYIFAHDQTGNKVADALERARQRGVVCRVLIDALGSRPALKALVPRLRQAGVVVHEMLPIGFFRRKAARLDLRNHRKIAVIDGRVGYTGSQNLVDAAFKPGLIYEELVVRVTGPIVLELQYVFVADWWLEAEEVLDTPDIFPVPLITGTVAAQALPSGPVFPTQNNQRLIVALVHGATERIVITTPYFIPDEPLLQALQTAVARGVKTHLIMSKKIDQLLVGLAQRSYYDDLLEAGVNIHLYRENFLHAKHLTIDDQVAVVGSSNMDIRSFHLNDEIMVLFYDHELTAQLHAVQERYIAHSELLTGAVWDQRSLFVQVPENLARLVSPLL